MEKENMYTLISKYFNDECTQDEIRLILDWCNQSEENEREFVQLKKVWIAADQESNEIISSLAPKVWDNISAEISEKSRKTSSTRKTFSKRALIYYASVSTAAVLFLMFYIHILTGEISHNNKTEYSSFYMPSGERGQLFLPDGTKVWLNASSKVTIANNFNAKNRTVMLEGEAYFDVAKSDKHKFIVQTPTVDVKVYGTAFSIAAYPDSEHVDVALRRGAVGVFRKDSDEELATLAPNQSVSVDKKTYLTQTGSFEDDTAIAWTFEELVFEHVPLKEVFAKMNNWYGVRISFESDPALQRTHYRLRIKDESLTEILELINKITPIDYKINGKEVHIRYK